MRNEMFGSYFSGLIDRIIKYLSTFQHLTQNIKMREIAIS